MKTYRAGIDIGSTTVKLVVLDENDNIIYGDYRRHQAHTQQTLAALLREAREALGDCALTPAITGSGSINLGRALDIPFVQEVVAVASALEKRYPQTDVAIELGGEDAKIIYFTGGLEERMNGVCAGGTGSFIDQMAALLQTDAKGLNDAAADYKELYTIAARCGVFAKTDIQPLINEGATTADLAASIFQAVVNQTISGLACGKPIRGCVAFLGGPLHFLPELKKAFIRTLKLTTENIVDPDDSHLFAAMGAALETEADAAARPIGELIDRLAQGVTMAFEIKRLPPLFADRVEYDAFCARHAHAVVEKGDIADYRGDCFLGIDAGSTTTKLALTGADGQLLWSYYANNSGSPIKTAMAAMAQLATLLPPTARIARSCSTGYGEALLKAAFHLDEGEVETIAHYHGSGVFRSAGGLRAGHRRAGHEVHPSEKRHGGQRHAERGLLLRLRLISGKLCQFLGLHGGAVRRRGLVRPASGGSGHPLHRVHELQREAGPEGGRCGVGHFRRPCLLRHQERAVQGHQAGRRPGAGPSHRGAGRHLLQQGRAAGLRAYRRG